MRKILSVMLLVTVMALGACAHKPPKATDAPAPIVRATRDLFLVLVLQAVIGYTQYFTGLPAWLVLCHMAGACAVWLSAWRVFMAMRTRNGAAAEPLKAAEALAL